MASSVVYRRKCALIIGINNYASDPLRYCVNDAQDLSNALRRINFEITLKLDCNQKDFYDTIDRFVNTIHEGDLILFYFAGHGKQMEDQNYLLPFDYDYDHRGHERDYIADHAINVQYIIKKIDKKKGLTAICILDCCRNLVRTRSTNANQGLLPIHAPLQTLIVYACAPGRAVLDETRNKRNGSFIENLLKHIETPNRDIEEIMKNVANDVHEQTDGVQLPYRTSSLTKSVYLVTNNNQNTNVYSNAHIRCRGRACIQCGRCRDWYWPFHEQQMCHFKRNDAQCVLEDQNHYKNRDDYRDSDFHVVCQCEDNRG